MKKIAVILLLLVHLFNIGGYALVSAYFIHESDVQIVKQIYDNKIDNAKLIEIKIPVSLPGIADWPEYEQIDGQIQFNGSYYHYVRLRMTHDTMSMICIPNDVKTRLTVATNIITAKQISDVPLSKGKSGHEPLAKKSGIGQDYNFSHTELYHYTAFSSPLKITQAVKTAPLSRPYIKSPGKPPNFSC